jgi:hypothetical protein
VTERGFVYIRKEKDWWEGGKICIYDIGNIVDPSWSPEIDSHPEPVFLRVYGAQESILRHQFRQPM